MSNRNHHFSHIHASFWLETEQSSNQCQNLVSDKTGTRRTSTVITELQPPKVYLSIQTTN